MFGPETPDKARQRPVNRAIHRARCPPRYTTPANAPDRLHLISTADAYLLLRGNSRDADDCKASDTSMSIVRALASSEIPILRRQYCTYDAGNMKSVDWSSARRHLEKDPIMRRIMDAVGPCTLKPRRDHFVLLCKSIYSQQISTTVAAVLFGRFRQRFPLKRPTPQRVLKLLTEHDDEDLRGCGLSRQKKTYLVDLSRHFISGAIPSH